MKNLTKILHVIAVLSCLISFSEATAQGKYELLYEENFKIYLRLESDSQRERKSEDWDLVGRTFYRIYSEDPEWRNAQLSLFTASRVYEKKYLKFNSTKDAETAIRYSRELVEKYPMSNYVDDSLLREGRMLEALGEKEKASAVYRKIINEMPESSVRKIAEKELAELSGKTATTKLQPLKKPSSSETAKSMAAVISSIKDSTQRKTETTKPQPPKKTASNETAKSMAAIISSMRDSSQRKTETIKPQPPKKTASSETAKSMAAIISSMRDSSQRKTETIKKSETVKRQIPEGYATVKKIRHWSTEQDDYTRVVIEVDKKIDYSENLLNPDPELNTPPRLYVDLEKTFIDDSVNIEPMTKGLLEKITYGENRPGVSRIVLYIKSFDEHTVFALPKSDQNSSYRIVMDIKGVGADPKKIFAEGAPSYDDKTDKIKPGSTIESEIPEQITNLTQALGLKKGIVVIDPGHGGHDPGAIGPSGLKEKDVVLKIAKRLEERLATEGKEFGIEDVYLTRSTDRYIPLEERTAIAKKKEADIFISIHSNAARNNKAQGIETYILGFTEDQSSLQLAARENAMTTKGLHDLRNLVGKIVTSSKKGESEQVARHVQSSIIKNVSSKYSPVKDRGVKKAPFVVLIGADIPSLLIETAFITNKKEEKRLQSAAYIEKVVNGIIEGIKKYSKQNRKSA